MSTVLEDVIHPDQACAVSGRKITDSLVLTRDANCYERSKYLTSSPKFWFWKSIWPSLTPVPFSGTPKNGLSKEVYSLSGTAVQGPCQLNSSKWSFIQGGKYPQLRSSEMSFISSSVRGFHRATGTDLEKGQIDQMTGRSWNWQTDSYLCFLHGWCYPFGRFIYTKSNGLDWLVQPGPRVLNSTEASPRPRSSGRGREWTEVDWMWILKRQRWTGKLDWLARES